MQRLTHTHAYTQIELNYQDGALKQDQNCQITVKQQSALKNESLCDAVRCHGKLSRPSHLSKYITVQKFGVTKIFFFN